jgi:putative hemolysin
MIGCASLEGTDPANLSGLLAFLHRHAAGEAPWTAAARADRRVAMKGSETLTPAEAFRALPPLLKGYLRLGAMVGDGAVVDMQFRTTDVLIILPVERIGSRYLEFFAPQATRDAA